jgi:hypothetical protein
MFVLNVDESTEVPEVSKLLFTVELKGMDGGI